MCNGSVFLYGPYRRGERDITRPCEGLSPRSTRGGDARQYLSGVTAACRSPKPLVGVQIPPGMPFQLGNSVTAAPHTLTVLV